MTLDLDRLNKEERLHRMRHSAAHVMAEAVLSIFPEAKMAIGPPIDNGFYYDFDLPRPISVEDLARIEELMRERIQPMCRLCTARSASRKRATSSRSSRSSSS